ncbi:MAG: hypothetical protein LBL58_13915 [Tannerellaceae bacterium]|jgi:hypothetical protein|nr:hypothetical protein [Tannerellaceae bacterium]
MEDLLKAYMDQSDLFWSSNNEIIGYDLNGHICEVRYKPLANDGQRNEIINIWEILPFLFREITNKDQINL